jgi:hypothetical protein
MDDTFEAFQLQFEANRIAEERLMSTPVPWIAARAVATRAAQATAQRAMEAEVIVTQAQALLSGLNYALFLNDGEDDEARHRAVERFVAWRGACNVRDALMDAVLKEVESDVRVSHPNYSRTVLSVFRVVYSAHIRASSEFRDSQIYHATLDALLHRESTFAGSIAICRLTLMITGESEVGHAAELALKLLWTAGWNVSERFMTTLFPIEWLAELELTVMRPTLTARRQGPRNLEAKKTAILKQLSKIAGDKEVPVDARKTLTRMQAELGPRETHGGITDFSISDAFRSALDTAWVEVDRQAAYVTDCEARVAELAEHNRLTVNQLNADLDHIKTQQGYDRLTCTLTHGSLETLRNTVPALRQLHLPLDLERCVLAFIVPFYNLLDMPAIDTHSPSNSIGIAPPLLSVADS